MREAAVLPVQDGEAPVARKPGRPRSERAERAILDAALELFAESGLGGFSIEAVAARAGVGKATIYRRWPGKQDLLLDALATVKTPLPEPAGRSVRDDLVAMLETMCADSADPRRTRLFTLLLGEGEACPRLVQRYKETIVEPRREMIRSVLRRGVVTGELRPDADVEIAMLSLTGAVIAMGKHDSGELTSGFAERVVNEAMIGLSPRPGRN
jgi:AcrR family transcriptional regulator